MQITNSTNCSMPFMPNVPHIVGDDDDLSEMDDNAQISEANPHSVEVGAPSSPDRKSLDNESASSEHSESSYDNDSEANEYSNNSTAEEEDWSNNISYIVRTPDREPMETVALTGFTSISGVDLAQDTAPAVNGQSIDLTDEVAPKNVEKAVSECSSPMDEKPNENNAIPSINSTPYREFVASREDQHTSRAEQLKNSPSNIPNAINSGLDDFSPPTRRQSLRSAHRTIPVKTVPPPAKRARPRKSKTNNNNNNNDDSSPAPALARAAPTTVAARVTKRLCRRSLTLHKSPADKKPPVLLARPVEVTEYFTNISASLVSHRVNLLPFLYMRKRIDRLVGEAIAKTKMERENNPIQ